MTPATATEVDVGGHRVRLTNLDKVLFPETGFTKAEVVDYYARVAPVLLPHLAGRHITLKRFPNGVDGQSFFEKNCPSHRPPWVRTASVARSPASRPEGRRGRRRTSKEVASADGTSGGTSADGRNETAITYCTVDSTATLVWLANLAALELHAPMAHAEDPGRPAAIVFDLDPGAPADLVDCCEVGLWIRDGLDRLGLQCWAKTSGSKGLQVYVPLNTPTTHEATSAFAKSLAHWLEGDHPDRVVSTQRKDARVGRVLIDWSQNSWHKTTVSVYSLRARSRPTVSTPVTWDEVDQVSRTRDLATLVFETGEVLARVDERGDLFAPVLDVHQEIPGAPDP
jgi:bifunctional non-homologous end joining protein LigD